MSVLVLAGKQFVILVMQCRSIELTLDTTLFYDLIEPIIFIVFQINSVDNNYGKMLDCIPLNNGNLTFLGCPVLIDKV